MKSPGSCEHGEEARKQEDSPRRHEGTKKKDEKKIRRIFAKPFLLHFLLRVFVFLW
jgi:hypothetical protein